MVLCGLGMQQYAMHNATIQKTTFFELGVYSHSTKYICIQGIILHPATVCLCRFKELVFIQLQGNYIIVNFQGNIFTQRKYIYSQKKIFIR